MNLFAPLAAQGRERSWSSVPVWLALLLAASLAAQLAWRSTHRALAPSASELPPAPSAPALRLAGMGEPAATARLAMLWLQAFDSAGGNTAPYQRLDYARLIPWLEAILATDPRSGYPLFAAARVYAETVDLEKMRLMLGFIERAFNADPNQRWAPLAHAALLAKHRLKDLPLARRYAALIERHATDESVPLWARQMEIFILEEMDELKAASIMIGGLLATGRIRDPVERRFLEGRLEELEHRLKRR